MCNILNCCETLVLTAYDTKTLLFDTFVLNNEDGPFEKSDVSLLHVSPLPQGILNSLSHLGRRAFVLTCRVLHIVHAYRQSEPNGALT